MIGRVVGQKLYELWKQQVVVDNRPGGGGRLAMQIVATAPPDGHVQLLTLNTNFTIDRIVFKTLPYDPEKAFLPITIVASTSQVLVSNPAFPPRTVRELIAFCKLRPGQVNYGSSGIGATLHLAMELFKSMANIDIVHVPYKGGPLAVTDVISGRIPIMFFNAPGALPYIKAAKLRPLGVSSARRSDLLPDVPTIAESGLPGFDTEVWFGLAAPAGTPATIINKTYRDVAHVLQLPEVRKQILNLGADPIGNTPEEFASRIKVESAKWAKVIEAARIRFE